MTTYEMIVYEITNFAYEKVFFLLFYEKTNDELLCWEKLATADFWRHVMPKISIFGDNGFQLKIIWYNTIEILKLLHN